MMVLALFNRLKLFKNLKVWQCCILGISTVLLFFSCSHLEVKQPPPLSSRPLGILRAELLNSKPVAGSLTGVVLEVPALENPVISGSFEGISFIFFEVPKKENFQKGVRFYQSFFGIPYERDAGPGTVEVQVGSSSLSLPIDVQSGDYLSESLSVEDRRAQPTSKRDLVRIQQEKLQVAQVYKQIIYKKHWTGSFLWPIQSEITSPFGIRRNYNNGKLKNFHSGVDLRASVGTPVQAPAPGEVVLVKDLFFTGNTIILNHGYGLVTLYAHLSRPHVQVGKKVQTGDVLGYSGKTGRVNGPHLHWQAVIHQVKIDPRGLLTKMLAE